MKSAIKKQSLHCKEQGTGDMAVPSEEVITKGFSYRQNNGNHLQ